MRRGQQVFLSASQLAQEYLLAPAYGGRHTVRWSPEGAESNCGMSDGDVVRWSPEGRNRTAA